MRSIVSCCARAVGAPAMAIVVSSKSPQCRLERRIVLSPWMRYSSAKAGPRASLSARPLIEEDLPLLVRHRSFTPQRFAALIGALCRRALRDHGMPALHFRKRGEVERCPGIRIDPRIAGHVGDGVFVTGHVLAIAQALVEYTEQA